MKRTILMALGAATLLAGTAAFAGPGHRGGHGPGFLPLRGIVHQIDLDENQQAMIDGWREQAQAERETRRDARWQARETVKAELMSGNPDAEVLHALVDEHITMMSEIMHRRVDHLVALYATFTPEQVATVQELIEEGPPGRGRGWRGGPDGARYTAGPCDGSWSSTTTPGSGSSSRSTWAGGATKCAPPPTASRACRCCGRRPSTWWCST